MNFPLRSGTIAACLHLLIASALAQVTVTDDLQRSVTLPAPATRIVSLAPSITESLFAIGAGDQVVGVTDFCNYPPEVSHCRRVGGLINPNIEAIVALSPDLIIFSMEGNQRQDFTSLSGVGVPLFVTNPRDLDGINRSLTDLGNLTGRTREAAALVRTLTQRAGELRAEAGTTRTRVLMFVSIQPLVAVGAHTFLNELLTAAGGDNLATSTGLTYPPLSREAVLAENPAVVFVASEALDTTATLVALYPEWSRLSAVQEGRVYRVTGDLVSRPGPRAVDGLALLMSYLRREKP